MGYQDNSALVVGKRLFKHFLCINVKVVGRLVKDKHIASFKHHDRKTKLCSLAAAYNAHLFKNILACELHQTQQTSHLLLGHAPAAVVYLVNDSLAEIQLRIFLVKVGYLDIFVPLDSAVWNKNIKISYFDQENSQLDFSKTVIDEIHDRRRGMTEQQVRSLLGLVKLTGENVFKKVGVISGGERAKLCFAIMMLERGNVLILDEPTNHLDIDAKEVLEQALSDYEGTVILVSHDRYLLSKICGRIFEITPGKLEEFNDGFEQYLTQKRARAEAAQAEIAAAKQENLRRENEEKKAVSYRSKEQRARDAKRRARIKELEKLIGELETQMAAVQQEMVSPEVTGDYVLMNEKCAEFESLKKQSSDYSDEWLELCEEEESLK